MIPLAVPNLSGNERAYLNNCIDTTFVSSVGEYVTKMEQLCAEACESTYAVATSSGTTGLHAALMAAGVNAGDLVMLPTFTFIASANAVAHCGASPWLMDIDEDWTIAPDLAEEALKEECQTAGGQVIHRLTGRRVAAIMPVYTLGNIPDMNRFRQIADAYHLPLIADAACAVGATRNGRQIGSLADLSVLSFNGNKTITCGGGGMVVGNDKAMADNVRHITTTARTGEEYDFDMVGYNYRMTNVEAAIGCAQMERLSTFIQRKRTIRKRYEEGLKHIGSISFFPETEGSACWMSGIVFREGGLSHVRQMCKKMKEAGIEARTFWKPVHLQAPYRDAPVFKADNATAVWENIMTLPCSTGITDEEIESVIGAVAKLL